MNLDVLSWNCGGICNDATVRVLKDLITQNRPHIVFLYETKISRREEFERLQHALGFAQMDQGNPYLPDGCQGVSLSFLGVLLVTFWIYCGLKRRKFKILKEKYFKDNGGFLLQQKLENFDGPQAAKIFTREELKKATNNFHDSLKIGEGGYGFVYKGTLSNGNEVAIKVSKSSAPMTQSNQFINEVIVLSQINHRNAVKLLGCCLETQTPLLVYEFVSNGTLYEHIHKKNGKGPLSFGLRMKIATETSASLAFLHYSTSMQIVHRDVKAANILLDENFTAKVGDEGEVITSIDYDRCIQIQPLMMKPYDGGR
ncbi:wall-associated receptor kinase 5 [Rosa chinensis]|uniref:wall-associated receptor kinase 5 n=1 Tax=Rosa chinensis TaxID=74649 RepID=UPI001AD8CB1C|nr:wall-associated receptor kinase 5 [Rosa chinensis]